MKITEKKQPVNTLPDGIWEGSDPVKNQKEDALSITADLQGNGYPSNRVKNRNQTQAVKNYEQQNRSN